MGNILYAEGGSYCRRQVICNAEKEDFRRVNSARTVHIISAPYYKANPVSGA
eukprot:COSAG05_NODE_19548_length_291_cov_0.536458_1_plen_51_part_10